jgi:hypothetical protein
MTAPRTAEIIRHTTETKIDLHLTIEGRGLYKVSTGIRFFDHMLELFTRHGGFDLELDMPGDLDVDQHHTVEDVGHCARRGFRPRHRRQTRHQSRRLFLMPMDETWPSQRSTSAAAPRTLSKPRSARDSSAICNPSWSQISLKDSRAARRRMSMSKPCTGAATITRSKRSSKPLRALCGSPALAIANWQRCCRPRKACYSR